ncbi:MAG: hypothetical protein PHI22_00370 [Bacilli bacterium]|nr:hypothetical protein [Bacilli bacterium]
MKEIYRDGKIKYYLNDEGNRVHITDKEGKQFYFSDDFVDISYRSSNSVACLLSNLYPIAFNFKGNSVSSIEGVLQALKHKDFKTQRLIFNYSGKDAYHTRAASFLSDWRETGILYFNNEAFNRFDIDYQFLLNDLYLSAFENPLYASALKYTGKRELLHSIGKTDPRETILTTREYIDRLLILRDYVDSEIRIKFDQLSDDIVKKYNNSRPIRN